MKNLSNAIICVSFIVGNLTSCISTPSDAHQEYSIIYDNEFDRSENQIASSAWMSYASYIQQDMKMFYANDSEAEYFIPFDVEVVARIKMLKFYARMISDPLYAKMKRNKYIEDMIKIYNDGYFNEYVYFSFTNTNWNRPESLKEDEYKDYMLKQHPEHVALTMVKVIRQE